MYFLVCLALLGRRVDPAGQPDPAGLHAGGRAVPRLDLRRPADAAAAQRGRAASPPTCSRAIRSSSITPWRTAGGGTRRWPCSSRTRWSRSTARSPARRPSRPRVFFPRVPGQRADAGPLAVPEPKAGQVPVPRPGPRHALARSASWSIGSRSRCPTSSSSIRRIGQLTRRWLLIQRQATENRRGQRHDRSAQQMEYHGLRDYRSGDSPRWIHWRTSARRGKLMVKEFEQQNEQDLAILVDPWLPRTKATPEQREAVEQAIPFAATVCLETCRHQGRRLLLGWTGPTPGRPAGAGLGQAAPRAARAARGPPAASEGGLAELLDVLPPVVLREAILIVVSTRPLNLLEEAERSATPGRHRGAGPRGPDLAAQCLAGRPDPAVPARREPDPQHPAASPRQRDAGASVDPGPAPPRGRIRGRGRTRSTGPTGADGAARPGRTSREQLSHLPRQLLSDALRGDHGLERRHQRGPVLPALPAVRRASPGFVAFLTVDRHPHCALPGQLANLLALATIGLSIRVPARRHAVDPRRWATGWSISS